MQDSLWHWSDHLHGVEVEGASNSIYDESLLTPRAYEQDRAEKAIRTITESTPAPKTPGKLKFLSFDLNDLDSVKAAAATFAQQEPKLDVLWNNAGTGANMVDPGSKTKQGFEAMVGMHCVATLLFTQLVLPQLRAAVAASTTPGSVRVVWTSSFLAEAASPTNGVNFAALENGVSNRTQNYAVSKVGTWMLAREMARRHGNGKDDIVSVVQNPGNLNAGSYSGTPPVAMFFIRPLLHHSIFGAYTELFAGLSPTISPEQNGSYVIPWGRIRSDKDCPRKDIIKAMSPTGEGGMGYDTKFWEWCEEQWKPFV